MGRAACRIPEAAGARVPPFRRRCPALLTRRLFGISSSPAASRRHWPHWYCSGARPGGGRPSRLSREAHRARRPAKLSQQARDDKSVFGMPPEPREIVHGRALRVRPPPGDTTGRRPSVRAVGPCWHAGGIARGMPLGGNRRAKRDVAHMAAAWDDRDVPRPDRAEERVMSKIEEAEKLLGSMTINSSWTRSWSLGKGRANRSRLSLACRPTACSGRRCAPPLMLSVAPRDTSRSDSPHEVTRVVLAANSAMVLL